MSDTICLEWQKKVSDTICLEWRKKVSDTICLETPAFGRGRVACGDRQMVPDTFFRHRVACGDRQMVSDTFFVKLQERGQRLDFSPQPG